MLSLIIEMLFVGYWVSVVGMAIVSYFTTVRYIRNRGTLYVGDVLEIVGDVFLPLHNSYMLWSYIVNGWTNLLEAWTTQLGRRYRQWKRSVVWQRDEPAAVAEQGFPPLSPRSDLNAPAGSVNFNALRHVIDTPKAKS